MIEIIGTGSYLPMATITNEEIARQVETTSAKWVEENLGIKERRVADYFETTSFFALRAAERAIEDSGKKPTEIDLLIVATATPDMKAPSTACLIQDKIGAYNAVCFDVSAVCSGFIYAMQIASSMIFMGPYNNALIIGADTFSTITDWKSRDCVFFGDGAGAVVVTLGDGLQAIRLYSDARGNGFSVPKRYFEMNGRAVYDTAIDVLPKAINEVLEDADMTIDDIDLMIPHQPSMGVLKETAKRIGLPWEKVMTNMDKYANTAGATIPILLDEVRKAGKLKGNVLLAAMGSGWTWGAAILKI